MDRRLVDHFVTSNIISRAAMQRLILRASKDKTGVVEKMLEDDKVDESSVARGLAEFYDLKVVESAKFSVNKTALKFLSKQMADKHGVLPFDISDGLDQVTVAVFDPEGASDVLDTIRLATGNQPSVQVAPRSWLREAIRHFYFGESWASAPVESQKAEDEPAFSIVTRRRKKTAKPEEAVKPPAVELLSEPADAPKPPSATMTTEESAEILLEDVVADPPIRRKKQAEVPRVPTATTRRPAAPVVIDEAPRRKKSSPKHEPVPPKPEPTPEPRKGTKVEQALEDFDAFLDSEDNYLSGGSQSGSASLGNPDKVFDPNVSDWSAEAGAPLSGFGDNSGVPFSLEDSEAAWKDESGFGGGPGFDLFDEQSEAEVTLQDIVERHEKTIAKLAADNDRLQTVVQSLVDMLSEARVISKKELKKRLK